MKIRPYPKRRRGQNRARFGTIYRWSLRFLAQCTCLVLLVGCSYTQFDASLPDGRRVSGVAFNFINDRNLSVSSSPEDGFSGSYSNTPNADLASQAFGTIDKALDKIPEMPAMLEAREP